MSALAFLAPDATAAAARSPMHRAELAAGAVIEQRDGWEVAVSYGDEAAERARLSDTVGFADRSSLCKLELQSDSGALAALVAAVSDGLALEPGQAARDGAGVWWCPVTPTRLLALCEPADAGRLRAAATSAASAASGTVTVAELSCGLAALTLAGPLASELLARFCAIDVRPETTPVAGFRPGSVARTPGYVLREREDGLLLLCGWALGQYLWQVVSEAAGWLGGGPVGADALAAHRGAAGA